VLHFPGSLPKFSFLAAQSVAKACEPVLAFALRQLFILSQVNKKGFSLTCKP
jgi:hypothetical protein